MILIVETDFPVACDSPDHLLPWGTRRDSFRNPRFIEKLERFKRSRCRDFAVLDLGCAGGGFVKDCLDRGWSAIGLEGSDYSQKRGRGEWATASKALHTCDVTKPFTILDVSNSSRQHAKFDITTAWEVLEHIAEPDLAPVADNIMRHLRSDGLFIVSIAPYEEVIDGVALHQTVRPKRWWEEKLRALGFYPQPDFADYFAGQYVRGPKFSARRSFNLVLSRHQRHPFIAPRRLKIERVMDAWHGSRLQRRMSRLLLGTPRI